MSPNIIESSANRPARLFGLSREPKRSGDPLILTEDTTAWEIYNHKAGEVDREMIKDWNDSLNTLLIFTALYSAVLTAFIIESMKLLEEDPAETTRDILLTISKQLANMSFPAFEQASYHPPEYAVVVNGLFFTSLSFSLIASLLAVLALQWVANYDMGLNTSSVPKRALQRHVRFRGIEKWKMAELIASLPVLIFVALFLFFIGIADWLWHMNRAISSIVMGGIGICFLLYTITSVISIMHVDAPFRTPISKELVGLLRQAIEPLKNIVFEHSLACGENDNGSVLGNVVSQSLTFAKLEEMTFEGKADVALDGLGWLANNIEISPASIDAFIILLKELSGASALSLMDNEKMKEAPWEQIFELLSAPYIGKREYTFYELERARWICKGMGIIPQSFLSPACTEFLRDLRNSNDRSISGLAYHASYRQYTDRNPRDWHRLTLMTRAFQRASDSIPQIGDNYFHFVLLTAREEWPNLDVYTRIELVKSMVDVWSISSAVIRDGSSSTALSARYVHFILDFVVPSVNINTFEARYIAALYSGESYWDDQWNNTLQQLLRVMTQQLLAQISHKISFSFDYTKDLELFSSIVGLKQVSLDEEKDDFIWVMIDKLTERDESRELEKISSILLKGLRCRPTLPGWVDLILALDDFLARLPPTSSHFYSKISLFVQKFVKEIVGDRFSWNELARVRDPCIAWILSWRCPFDIQFEALVNPNFSSWNDMVEHEITGLFHADFLISGNMVDSNARISFFRAIMLDGPSNPRTSALRELPYFFWFDIDDSKCHQLFASPVLGRILEFAAKPNSFSVDYLLREIVQYRWFYGEFRRANGLDWLPLIALNNTHPGDRILLNDILAEVLVDQILSSAASQDIRAPLLSCYHYLESLGQIPARSLYESNGQGQSNLQRTLLWVLTESVKICNSEGYFESLLPVVSRPPLLNRRFWPAFGEVRSFDFVRDLSDEEWHEWVARLKVLIMGATLGGLKPCPVQNKNRFSRDPDGVCSLV
ncbi:hypothetical protein CPB86DRAFT_793958 [Serendipita vermifera]|nr:hypothetical protein CPB86DRAFT_793958 [Serendipita vermifera]